MKIQMKVQVSGTRNTPDGGTAWPPVGGEIEVPDEEGRDLVTSGMAVEVGAGGRPKKDAVDPIELDDHKMPPQPAIQARPKVVPGPNDRVDEVAGDRVVKRADGSVDSDPHDDAVSPGNSSTPNPNVVDNPDVEPKGLADAAEDEKEQAQAASGLTTKNGPTKTAAADKRGPGRPRKS